MAAIIDYLGVRSGGVKQGRGDDELAENQPLMRKDEKIGKTPAGQ